MHCRMSCNMQNFHLIHMWMGLTGQMSHLIPRLVWNSRDFGPLTSTHTNKRSNIMGTWFKSGVIILRNQSPSLQFLKIDELIFSPIKVDRNQLNQNYDTSSTLYYVPLGTFTDNWYSQKSSWKRWKNL